MSLPPPWIDQVNIILEMILGEYLVAGFVESLHNIVNCYV